MASREGYQKSGLKMASAHQSYNDFMKIVQISVADGSIGLDGTDNQWIGVAPLKDNGKPSVLVALRTDRIKFFEASIAGHPAIAFVLGEDQTNANNGPWELGHLLAENWERAKALPDDFASTLIAKS